MQAAGNDTASLSETSSASQIATTKLVGLVDTAQPRDPPWELDSVQTGRGWSHRADAESLLDALLEVDLEKVRKLLDAGVNPRRAIIQIAGSRPGCTQVEPLRRLLNKAVHEDCMHEVYPILELLLANTSHDLVELHGELQQSLLSPLLVSFIQNVGARALKDRLKFRWSKTDWQFGNPRGGFRDAPFYMEYYNTHVYKMAPIFANLLIMHGADPGYQATDSAHEKPLRLALESLNPAMASMLVLRLRGPAGDRKLRAPFLPYDSVDGRFTVMIVHNIRDQHRCMDTSPWLRYIIESDARIGARLLCKTITLLSHRSFLGFEASDIVAAVFALVPPDADPMLRVKISDRPDRPPFSASSTRYGNVIILGATSTNTFVTQDVNVLELINRVAIWNDFSPTTRSTISWRMRSAQIIPVAQRLRRE
ncbi:hypothetical protein MN608_08570 [Microdochium nivale]|nr:hypothetical protein MN608_08570 [Microdochium nivale]